MIDEAWVNRNLTRLTLGAGIIRPHEGDEFVFDPTPGFYGFIAQGTTDALNGGMRILAEHIGSPSRPGH